jgi:hypothetical protein
VRRRRPEALHRLVRVLNDSESPVESKTALRQESVAPGAHTIKIRKNSMENDEKQFEKYLAEFQPRRPRALSPLIRPTPAMARVAATAIVALALGTSLWLFWRNPTSHRPAVTLSRQPIVLSGNNFRQTQSNMVLTRLALESPSRRGGALNAVQERGLPRFDRQNSVLRLLARE